MRVRGQAGTDAYQAMKFMVNIDGTDVVIASGYSHTNILTTEAFHHLWLDSNVFIYRDCQSRNGDMRKKTLVASGGPYRSRDHATLYPTRGLAFPNTHFSPGFCLQV